MIEVSAYTKADNCYVQIKHKSYSISSEKKLSKTYPFISLTFVVLLEIILLFFKLLVRKYFSFKKDDEVKLVQNVGRISDSM